MKKNYHFLLFPGFKEKAVTLSYDDAQRFDERLVDIIVKNGFKATININSGLLGKLGYFTGSEAVDLYNKKYFEIAIHGVEHLSLPELSDVLKVKEIILDKIQLEGLFGQIIQGMAYANGAYDDDTIVVAEKCGIAYARTIISTEDFSLPNNWMKMSTTCHHDNPRLKELIDSFLNDDKESYEWNRNPKLFSMWGHSHEFEKKNNWFVFEDFARRMGNRDDIWYATNGEVYRYVKAFDALVYASSDKIIYNPSATDIYLRYFGKNVIIPAGETIKL